jgi:hypothetical protein
MSTKSIIIVKWDDQERTRSMRRIRLSWQRSYQSQFSNVGKSAESRTSSFRLILWIAFQHGFLCSSGRQGGPKKISKDFDYNSVWKNHKRDPHAKTRKLAYSLGASPQIMETHLQERLPWSFAIWSGFGPVEIQLKTDAPWSAKSDDSANCSPCESEIPTSIAQIHVKSVD